MALSTYALITEAEAKAWLDTTGTEKDELIRGLIEDCSDIVESYLDRQIVTRGSLTEYHTFVEGSSELFTGEWPIITVSAVAEDVYRTYGTALTVNTHYITSKPQKIIRIYSATGGETTWQTGFRAVRVTYSAGYATTAAVPREIKDVCKRLVALKYREVARKQQGLSGASDELGNWTRFGTPDLTDNMKGQLYNHKRNEFSTTAERDS